MAATLTPLHNFTKTSPRHAPKFLRRKIPSGRIIGKVRLLVFYDLIFWARCRNGRAFKTKTIDVVVVDVPCTSHPKKVNHCLLTTVSCNLCLYAFVNLKTTTSVSKLQFYRVQDLIATFSFSTRLPLAPSYLTVPCRQIRYLIPGVYVFFLPSFCFYLEHFIRFGFNNTKTVFYFRPLMFVFNKRTGLYTLSSTEPNRFQI